MTKRRRLPEPADESDIIAYLRDVLDDLNYSTSACVCCNVVYHIDSEQWHVSECCHKNVCDECFSDEYFCDCREEEDDEEDSKEENDGSTMISQQHLAVCVCCGATDDINIKSTNWCDEWAVTNCCQVDVCGRCSSDDYICDCGLTDEAPATNNQEST